MITILMDMKFKERFVILKETTMFYYKNEKNYQENKHKVPDGLIRLSESTPLVEMPVGSVMEYIYEDQGKVCSKRVQIK